MFNRKLVREQERQIVILKDANSELRDQVRYQRELKCSALQEKERFSGIIEHMKKDLERLSKENEELKTKTRNQNEADLMLVSVKIIADILKDKKVSKTIQQADVARQEDARVQYTMSMQQSRDFSDGLFDVLHGAQRRL